jgi:hypothetical protein
MVTKLCRYLAVYLLLSIYAYSQVVINELQAAPKSPEPEWIELFNKSKSTINLKNWYLSNYNSSKILPDFKIDQNQYCVLVKDTALLKSLKKIPSNAILIQLPIPVLHNGIDTITLRNSDSIIIDTFIYNSSWAPAGVSLERIDHDEPAISKANIDNCDSPDSSTIGLRNSIAINDYSFKSKTISNSIIIQNKGRLDIDSLTYDELYSKRLNNSSVLYNKGNLGSIKKKDSISFVPDFGKIKLNISQAGLYDYFFISTFSKNNQILKDTAKLCFYVSYEQGSILINEFLPNPTSSNGEFIEIYNTTKDTIHLKNYQISGRDSKFKKDSILIDCENCYILPNDYFAITNDSSFFDKNQKLRNSTKVYYKKSTYNLGASGDFIQLSDFNDKYLDSLNYTEDWYNSVLSTTKDISIEKKNKNGISNEIKNWIASKDSSGSTPAKVNSFDESIIADTAKHSFIEILPNPFSRKNYKNSEAVNIFINSELQIKFAKLQIFNTNGVFIKELESNFINSKRIESSWNGKDDKSLNLEVGPYLLFIQINFENGSEESYKRLIVIGE